MDAFLTLVHRICEKPVMYVGRCSLRDVSTYLAGYDHAMEDQGSSPLPLDGWLRWVDLRFGISHPAWHWTRILLHNYGSDRCALDALPALFEDFFRERQTNGIDAILAAHRKQLAEGRAPESTTTEDPFP